MAASSKATTSAARAYQIKQRSKLLEERYFQQVSKEADAAAERKQQRQQQAGEGEGSDDEGEEGEGEGSEEEAEEQDGGGATAAAALGVPNRMLRNRGTVPGILGVAGTGPRPPPPPLQAGQEQQLVPAPPGAMVAAGAGAEGGEEKGVFPTGILGRNGEVEVLDSGGATPLMLACHQGNPQLGEWWK